MKTESLMGCAVGDLVQTRVGPGTVVEVVDDCDYPYAMVEFWTGTVCGMEVLAIIDTAFRGSIGGEL